MNFSIDIRSVFDKSYLRKIEYVIAVVGVLFYAEALTGILTEIGIRKLLTLVRYFTLFGSITVLCQNFKDTRAALFRGAWVWPLTILTVVSFAWSVNPNVTIQSLRSEFIPLNIFGVFLSSRFNREQLFKILYATSLVATIASAIVSLALPSIGRHPIDHPYPGAWKGIFSHKNGLGVNLVYTSTFTFLKIICAKTISQWRNNLIILGCIYVVILFSESTASLLISIFVCLLVYIYKKFRWRGKLSFLILDLLIMIVGGGTVVLIGAWAPIMGALGKDPTMSARTLIWNFVLQTRVFPQSPLLGFGRGTFWQNPNLLRGIYSAAHHVPAHAHNGYVDLIADLGVLGLFLFLISFLVLLIKILRSAYRAKDPADLWQLNFIIVFLIGNIIESVLMRGESFNWLLYITIFCSVARSVKGRRLPSR